MIDFGLAVFSDGPLAEVDTFEAALEHTKAVERQLNFGLMDKTPGPDVEWPKTWSALDASGPHHNVNPERMQPIDFLYSPGSVHASRAQAG